MAQEIGLTDAKGTRIALKSVHIDGSLNGPLASMAITQRYCNDSGKKLEIVYTFPLAFGATLLGMDVTLGGRRLQGAVVEKPQAWKKYEEAIDDGDAPVLVEQTSHGLYTANLGNIEPGEDVVVELRYAQLLRVEQDRIRLSVPCVLAPRYGDPHKAGGLAPHESAASNIAAEYPLTIKIALLGQIAEAEIQCPSHSFSVKDTANGLAVLVNAGAMLDRDFILTLGGLEEHSFALLAPDSSGYMMLAGFHPTLSPENEPLRMKILVDCSGSMAGDSITQARRALQHLLGKLTPKDYISYSRFGSAVFHECGQMVPCEEEVLARLAAIIADTEANRGGTEMERALLSTFNDISMPPIPEAGVSAPGVLLITDGEIWDVEGLVAVAQASGQRVFAIGVGSAPAESLLRELAYKTGGACELVSPNEGIEAAITRMARKMRGARAVSPAVDWSVEPVWQSALPSRLYDGETVHVFAAFTEAPSRAPVLRWSMDGADEPDGRERQLSAETFSRTDDDAVIRLGGAARMAEAATPEEARELALKYQLLGKHTALFLIHEREGEKSAGLPVLHQVPQMMAAGHGGFGSVRRGLGAGDPAHTHIPYPTSVVGPRDMGAPRAVQIDDLEVPSFLRRERISILRRPESSDSFMNAEQGTGGLGAGRIPKWVVLNDPSYQRVLTGDKKWLDSFFAACSQDHPTPLELLQIFDERAFQEADAMQVMRLLAEGIQHHPGLTFTLTRISVTLKLPFERVLALFLDLLQEHLKDSYTLSRHAQRVLRALLNTMQDKMKDVVAEALAEECAYAAQR